MQQALQYGAYRKVEVETASQGKLIVMLFNGAIQRAEQAKRMLERKKLEGAHTHLIRAQEIISELRGALNMEAGDIALNLDRSYEYIHHVLVQANVKKDAALIDESIAHLEELRDGWQEAVANMAHEGGKIPPGSGNPHGSASLNIES